MNLSRLEGLQYARDKCPGCGFHTITADDGAGELVCRNCGLVVSERSVSQGPERWVSSEEGSANEGRNGAPVSITRRDMGLSAAVGRSNKDAAGKSFGPPMRSTIERLRRWDSRARANGARERNLGRALSELEKMGDKLSASRAVKERAAYFYRKALERGFLRGGSITSIAAAVLYAALRDTETPRTVKDVADASNLNKNEIARGYRALLREMDLTMPVADATKDVTRIASKIGMSEKTIRKAIEIVRMSERREISAGKAPMGLAASSLYLAGILEGDAKTQKEIADAAGVTEVTVRNMYKNLREVLGGALGMKEAPPKGGVL
ncbi:MAG: transcription initiation factor IIB [Thaumarchaeota archaeon]|nr:transcription initiation factor IIB [Nitrososphaerota archaeon]